MKPTAPAHKAGTWWQKVLAVAFVAFLVSKCNDLQQPKPPQHSAQATTQAAYREDFNQPLVKQIMKDGITGCGQMRWAQSASNEKLYMVECSRDGSNWVTHTVRVQ